MYKVIGINSFHKEDVVLKIMFIVLVFFAVIVSIVAVVFFVAVLAIALICVCRRLVKKSVKFMYFFFNLCSKSSSPFSLSLSHLCLSLSLIILLIKSN